MRHSGFHRVEYRLPALLPVILLWSALCPGEPQQGAPPLLEILVRPERVYVETLRGTDRADDRCVLHAIVVAGNQPVELDEIVVSLSGLSGGVVTWNWAGAALEAFLRESQPKIHGVAASSDLQFGPGEIGGLIGVTLAWDDRLKISEGNVLARGRAADGKPYEARATIPFTSYSPEACLGLPFEGVWYVSNGHESTVDAAHFQAPPSQFAYDFLQMGSKGRSYRRAGKSNHDYFAYNAPILAAADGKVAAVSDGFPDNSPGEMPPVSGGVTEGQVNSGNYVILEHNPKEFSLYAHLRPGTIEVKVGEQVRRGQILGRCGNSGMSSEPHLHFQLMDGPNPSTSIGLPATFHDFRRQDYRVDADILHPRELVRPDHQHP